MSGPTTYSEWVNLLDKFGGGDDTALEELRNGSFTLDAGTASRFYLKVEEVYKKRKQNWLDRFRGSFLVQRFNREDELEIILRNGKQNLLPLIDFVELKGLPEDLRRTLRKDLESFVAEIKRSLKDSISRASSSRERMLILLNTFDLNNIPAEVKTGEKKDKQVTNKIVSSKGRKIIF
jgi:hypothetical protein